MTKIRIGASETEYDLDAAIENVSNGTIKAMAKQSAVYGEPVTMDYLEKQRVRVAEMQADPEVTPLQLGTDIGYIDMVTAQIFMVKRHAGEQITWGEAEDFGPNAIVEVESDEPAPEVVEAPKDDAGISLPEL